MICDGIIFDLDGTLWDSSEGVQKAWGSVIGKLEEPLKIPNADDLTGIMGLTPEGVMQKLFPELTNARGAEIFELCSKAENEYLSKHGATLYPDLIQTLKALSESYPLFIVSNCGKGYIESFLIAHNTRQYFTDWECVGNTGLEKHENIQLIVKRNTLHQPIYVGDTIWDYNAATAAGVPFIHAAYGFGTIEQALLLAIQCPAQLLTLLSFPSQLDNIEPTPDTNRI